MNETNKISQPLMEALFHGREEVYLEYKEDVPWNDPSKKLDIMRTIFAMANERGGGTIVIGVSDEGDRVGLSEENYNTYDHDSINQCLKNKGNQVIGCKIEKYNNLDFEDVKDKRFVFIQVAEVKEFPFVYTGGLELIQKDKEAFPKNIGLRPSAIYIRSKSENGNKEIESISEWQELIERTYRKYERETLRRHEIIKDDLINPFDQQLSI